MRLSDYLTHYEREDLRGVMYALLTAVIASGIFIAFLETGREMISVSGIIQ